MTGQVPNGSCRPQCNLGNDYCCKCVANHGRYLIPADKTDTIDKYGDDLTEFDKKVRDAHKQFDAGKITVDYDTYSTGVNQAGGAALAGGFIFNAKVSLKGTNDDWTLHWVQIIQSNVTGDNAWNLPQANAGWFPDILNPLDGPAYPITNLSGVGSVRKLTPAYHDNPRRDYPNFNNGSTPAFWKAELGLVCIKKVADVPVGNQMGRRVNVIRTFEWGFELGDFTVDPPAATCTGAAGQNLPPCDVNHIVPKKPGSWGGPSQDYLTTLNGYFDGEGGGGGGQNNGAAVESGLFKFFDSSNCFEKESDAADGTPATSRIGILVLILAFLGASTWLALRRRARART